MANKLSSGEGQHVCMFRYNLSLSCYDVFNLLKNKLPLKKVEAAEFKMVQHAVYTTYQKLRTHEKDGITIGQVTDHFPNQRFIPLRANNAQHSDN